MRGDAVAVSESEKERLDAAAVELFGTENVAYGATLSALCSRVLDEGNRE
mgnify:CR=1 FL=1